ncbi:hypothetical protein A3D00_00910 [Candidatus Woesebacteria bacterium RIFCSPHIGHO2_02_FULL_38_9]|uniref:DDH domain-containing protein n=1 Tax=Candidatus Woesebacteria bacterium RIFCSPHIGHO2_01_FULL_39_28 TaxID=1802496 RepID=A0A1F7YF70_9BACT|nr:MAG: hypothetical protein A2627_02240 [Candidatus Woesebacteria bacterium RIFCSPHIGHO2_01_FULL_39_28]OGM31417.1 MAG: hypothetical protein A3D00_00910 [Candidatus Woesebacteria bacterium RIFCSPHIGHO2_02_FULL_38_9]OGM58155.1 MAG: hypothetical protein A3A50_00120 [Candidatus Woesebacteria bacterium RIFCSPLOWO2_01_FULL_38_20]
MHYKESKLILEKIRKANRILVNCHRSPDPDSVGSALSIFQVLRKFGKEVKIVSPDKIHENLRFLPYSEKVEATDFTNFNFSKYDLFLILDSSSFDQAIGSKNINLPSMDTIVIDHHESNRKFGQINIVDRRLASNCEVLYSIFEDWGIKIDNNTATTLYTGIVSDTGSFQYPETTSKTLLIASKLIDCGAAKNEIILNIFRSFDYKLLKLWGEMLTKMQRDKLGFAWVAISYETFAEYGHPAGAKSEAASLFFSSIKGLNFGIVMIEQRRKVLNLSFRSKTNFDVSRFAQEFGGAGHKTAAGAWFSFEDFNEAVNKVLTVARKFAKEYNSVI